MMSFAFVTACLGFLAVMLGAFGAHGLKNKLSAADLDIWQTANQYHFYHVFALLAVVIFWQRYPEISQWFWAATCFVIGIIIFSGSLYLLPVTGLRWLGAITPIGGVFFLIAWAVLAYACLQIK